jgi:hypothetical protein
MTKAVNMLNQKVTSLYCLYRYMFFFQLPWLPEFVFGLNDFEALEMNMRGENMGVRTEYVTSEDIEAYKYNYSSKSDTVIQGISQDIHLSFCSSKDLSLSTEWICWGVPHKPCIPIIRM